MELIGKPLNISGPGNWSVQKLIPEGYRTPKWGVFRNGRHIGSERTKKFAIAVIEWWPNNPPDRLNRH